MLALGDRDHGVTLSLHALRHMQHEVGGFVQDSWSVLDLVTLNAGLRYDQQTLFGNDGSVGMSLPSQWSPRVGLAFDPTQRGRSRIFASYASFFESVPLDVAGRSFPGAPQVVSAYATPAGGGTCTDPSTQSATGAPCNSAGNRITLNSPVDPNQKWAASPGGVVTVDPNLQAQSTTEWTAGAEYDVIDRGRVTVAYTKRYLNSVIENMSADEGQTFFIGNPGSGLAAGWPKATRNYDAVTASFTKAFADEWVAQASYTYSVLEGNYAGLYNPDYGNQLAPNLSSAFDLKSILPNIYGSLPGDITHRVKLYGAKKVILSAAMSLDIGLAYQGRSGTPISYLGAQPQYGPGVVYILPQGDAGRTPWVHDVDGHLTFTYRLNRDSAFTVGLDVFNIFNFDAATQVDQNYTYASVLPVRQAYSACTQPSDCGAPALTPAQQAAALAQVRYGYVGVGPGQTGQVLNSRDINPNFKNAIAYQAPRTVRFLARFTF